MILRLFLIAVLIVAVVPPLALALLVGGAVRKTRNMRIRKRVTI